MSSLTQRTTSEAGFWVCTGHPVAPMLSADCWFFSKACGSFLPSVVMLGVNYTAAHSFSVWSRFLLIVREKWKSGIFLNACRVDQRLLSISPFNNQHCKIRLSALVLTALKVGLLSLARFSIALREWGSYFFEMFNNIDLKVMAQEKWNSICGLE